MCSPTMLGGADAFALSALVELVVLVADDDADADTDNVAAGFSLYRPFFLLDKWFLFLGGILDVVVFIVALFVLVVVLPVRW